MESIITKVLSTYLSVFVKGFSRENFHLSTMNGNAALNSIELDENALHYLLQLPDTLEIASVKCEYFGFHIPFRSLNHEPVVITLKSLFVNIRELPEPKDFPPSPELVALLGSSEPKQDKPTSGPSKPKKAKKKDKFFVNIIQDVCVKLIDLNLNILLLHSPTTPEEPGPLVQLTVPNIVLQSTNEKWEVVDLKAIRDRNKRSGIVVLNKELAINGLRMGIQKGNIDYNLLDLQPMKIRVAVTRKPGIMKPLKIEAGVYMPEFSFMCPHNGWSSLLETFDAILSIAMAPPPKKETKVLEGSESELKLALKADVDAMDELDEDDDGDEGDEVEEATAADSINTVIIARAAISKLSVYMESIGMLDVFSTNISFSSLKLYVPSFGHDALKQLNKDTATQITVDLSVKSIFALSLAIPGKGTPLLTTEMPLLEFHMECVPEAKAIADKLHGFSVFSTKTKLAPINMLFSVPFAKAIMKFIGSYKSDRPAAVVNNSEDAALIKPSAFWFLPVSKHEVTIGEIRVSLNEDEVREDLNGVCFSVGPIDVSLTPIPPRGIKFGLKIENIAANAWGLRMIQKNRIDKTIIQPFGIITEIGIEDPMVILRYAILSEAPTVLPSIIGLTDITKIEVHIDDFIASVLLCLYNTLLEEAAALQDTEPSEPKPKKEPKKASSGGGFPPVKLDYSLTLHPGSINIDLTNNIVRRLTEVLNDEENTIAMTREFVGSLMDFSNCVEEKELFSTKMISFRYGSNNFTIAYCPPPEQDDDNKHCVLSANAVLSDFGFDVFRTDFLPVGFHFQSIDSDSDDFFRDFSMVLIKYDLFSKAGEVFHDGDIACGNFRLFADGSLTDFMVLIDKLMGMIEFDEELEVEEEEEMKEEVVKTPRKNKYLPAAELFAFVLRSTSYIRFFNTEIFFRDKESHVPIRFAIPLRPASEIKILNDNYQRVFNQAMEKKDAEILALTKKNDDACKENEKLAKQVEELKGIVLATRKERDEARASEREVRKANAVLTRKLYLMEEEHERFFSKTAPKTAVDQLRIVTKNLSEQILMTEDKITTLKHIVEVLEEEKVAVAERHKEELEELAQAKDKEMDAMREEIETLKRQLAAKDAVVTESERCVQASDELKQRIVELETRERDKPRTIAVPAVFSFDTVYPTLTKEVTVEPLEDPNDVCHAEAAKPARAPPVPQRRAPPPVPKRNAESPSVAAPVIPHRPHRHGEHGHKTKEKLSSGMHKLKGSFDKLKGKK